MRCAAILLCLGLPAFAADNWVRAVTPHFELYTTSGEKKAREAILYFEQVKAFFMKASPVKAPGEFPTRIVAFHDPVAFQSFSYNNNIAAYFAGSPNRDYIVMQDPAGVNYRIAIHEYMHLIIRHSGLRLPTWLNEGWADVFSTMRSDHGGVAVGDLIPGREQALLQNQWLDFQTLTSVDNHSPIYNEAARIGIFYAQSWALVHMLYLSPEYEKGFPRFLAALNRGTTADEACKVVWGKSGDQIMTDLRNYFSRKQLLGRVFLTAMDKTADAPVVSPPSPFDTDLVLADLLAAIGRGPAARREYERLANEQPTRADVAVSQGFLALQTRDAETARADFEKAFGLGSNDPQMCYQLAILQREAKEPPERYLASMERAVKAKPDSLDYKIQLGLLQGGAREFPAVIETLMAIDTVPPDRAPVVFGALAYAYLETGDVAEARAKIDVARKYASAPAESQGANMLYVLIDARSKGPFAARKGEKLQRVTGTAVAIDCPASGPKMRLQAAGREIVMDLPDVSAVELAAVNGKAAGSMSCGALSMPVTVEYAPPGIAEGSAGILRRIEY